MLQTDFSASILTIQRPPGRSASGPSNRPVCFAPDAPVYIGFISGRPHHWGIVNFGEKVRSTVGMRYCRKLCKVSRVKRLFAGSTTSAAGQISDNYTNRKGRTGRAVAMLSRKHAYNTSFVIGPMCNSCLITVALLLLPKWGNKIPCFLCR